MKDYDQRYLNNIGERGFLMFRYCIETIKKVFLILVLVLQCSTTIYAITNTADLKDIKVDEKLGNFIPLDLSFYDEDARLVKLGDFFKDGKPVVLTLNYYECPMLCTYILNGVLNAVNELNSLSLGQDFKIVSVSFNPAETPELAKAKSQNYHKALKNGQSQQKDWPFLTGNQENIDKLTQAVGFRYKKDGKEFAHPSTIVILTPQAKISRYLYGIQYEPKDVKLALLEASNGNIGSSKLLNKVLVYCYEFDPVGRRYALQALNVVKAGGVVTLSLVAGLLVYFWRREKKESK